jgi:O-antigen ligase
MSARPLPAPRAISRVLVLEAGALSLFAAVGGGTAYAAREAKSPRELLGLTVVLVLSVALVGLACTGFRAVVITLLLLRSSLDAFHVGSGLDPATVLGALFAALAVVWLLARLANGTFVAPSRSATSLLLLGAMGMATATAAYYPTTALTAAFRIVGGALMLIVLEQLVAEDQKLGLRLPLIVIASGAVPVSAAFYQSVHHLSGFVDSSGFSRVSGTFVHPDSLATYLAMSLMAAYAMAALRGRRTLMAVAYGLGTFALFLTYSRGGWIALLAGVLVVTWRRRRALLLPVVIGLVALVAAVPGVTARFADVTARPHANGTPANSMSWRIYYWKRTAHYLRDRPATGIGLDGIQRVESQGVEPHNFFVQAGVEMGVGGLAAALLVAISVYRDLRRARRRLGVHDVRVAVAIGATAALFVQALLTNVMTEAVIYWYWAALVAPAVCTRALPMSSSRFQRRPCE